MTTPVTVAIPVGPRPDHCTWLRDALDSVMDQTYPAAEIVLVDDMHDLDRCDPWLHGWPVRVWRAPWRLGVAHAMNVGVALARSGLVFMACADDTLEPTCLERCVATYETQPEDSRDRSYYFVGVRYMDDRAVQFVPCGAAMVPRSLFQHNGGFPPETGSGAPDAALISAMMVHPDAGRLVGVADYDQPLYNARRHPGQDTATRGPWQGVILATRDLVTELWKPVDWSRTEP